MIFKRYPSPFLFLDNLLSTYSLVEIVDFLFKQEQEEKWWNLYLATLPLNDKPYETWRKESSKGTVQNSSTSKIDAKKTIRRSQEILSGYKPPQ